MTGNPPPLDPALRADLAIQKAEQAMQGLAERKAWWDKVNGFLLAGQDRLKAEQTDIEERVSTRLLDRPINFAKRLLSRGKYQGPVLDSLASDLQSVQRTLRGGGMVAAVRNAVLTPTDRKAQSLGLPTDPVALYQKKIELSDSLSLTNFSASLALDPLTRGSRRMDKYLAALESGNYTKALKLASAEPPLSVRWQFWAPWKAQAMRDDRAALMAGVESYRRTKEAAKAADGLLNTIEKDAAKALLKVAHSPEWQRLRARPGIEKELAGNPVFAILMKYSPEDSPGPGLISRMQKGHPSLKDLRADLLEARMEGMATGKPFPTGQNMAAALNGLVEQVETARRDLRDLHAKVGDQIRDYGRSLRENTRLARNELTARAGENGARINLADHFEAVLQPVRVAAKDAKEAPGEIFRAKQERLDAARDVREAHKNNDPDALADASTRRDTARTQYTSARKKFVDTQGRLEDLLRPDGDLADAFARTQKQALSEGKHTRIEDAAAKAAQGKLLPKDTPGLSFLQTAFTAAAQRVDGVLDKVVVNLDRILECIAAAAAKTEPLRKERIEPVFA